MKIKTQLTLAAVIAAGMLASGCSQMGAQQVSANPEPQAPAPAVKTVVDCSSCNKPAAPVAVGGAHTHPAVPACTNTISHTHKFTNPAHKHAYSCKKGPARQKLVKPPSRPKLVRPPVRTKVAPRVTPRVNKWAHTHPAVPGCTNSITHSHPYNNARHSHRYSCRGQRVAQQPRVAQPQRVAPAVNKWAHTHPAVPGCTNSITHVHPYNNTNHSHRYSCRGNFRPQPQPQYRPPAMPVMPKVKAKGTYRGPIQIDGGVMQQYQQ